MASKRSAPPRQADTGDRARTRPAPKTAPKRTAPPRQSDTGDRARTRPAPAPVVKPVFKPVATTAPFARQQAQAQQQVRATRRRLPAPALAEPPIISTPKPAKTGGETMSRGEVAKFLASQSATALHAREQIVKSIRHQVGNVRGAERVEAVGRLMDEIATDPRLARTRAAIRHYTAIEAETARPQTTATAKPGKEPRKVGLGFATLNLTATSQAAQNVAEKTLPGLAQNDAAGKITRNALSDIAHLPIMAPQTLYEVSMAAKEAAGGDPTRAKELAKGLLDGVYGHLVRGDVEGAVEYFREHPVYAVLEVRGGKGVVGRGAGAAMRSGALGGTAKRVASTQRKDLALSGEGARVADRQHYSPDVLTKLAQVAWEKHRGGKGPVLGDHRLRRRADFESDMAAGTSRAVRSDEAKKAKDAKPKGPLAAVVGLAVQGVIRPASLEADLRKELARLDNAHATAEFSTGAQKRQNRTTADAIRKVLGSPAAMARIGEIAQSGRANVRSINDLEGQAAGLGAITPERAERAALFPAAQAHLGAEYSDAPFRAAREREVAAARRLRSATTQQRQARVTYARKLNSAQRHIAEKRRQYLRRDETYSELEKQHGSLKAQKEALRAPLREAERTGKKVDVQEGWETGIAGERVPKMVKRSAAQIRKTFDELATQQRSTAGALASRAKVLHEKPTVRTVKSGPNKGKKVPTGKAGVKRAERQVIALRAARDKPSTSMVPLAREAFDRARAERFAAQRGGTQSLNRPGQGPVYFHGSNLPPDVILKQGLRPGDKPGRERAVFLGTDARTSHSYGEHIYAVDPRYVERIADLKDDIGEISPAKRTGQPIPPGAIRYLGRHEGKGGGYASFERRARNAFYPAERLSNDTIRAAVGEDVAYLPHHTQNRGARAYYQTSFAGRKNLDASKKRTGAAFEKGAVDVSYDAVKEHRIRMRGVVNRIAEHDRIIHSIAIKSPGGKMFTWDQAEKIASNAADRGVKLVPYRAVPGSYDRARMEGIMHGQGAPDVPNLEELVGHEFKERLKAPAPGDETARNVVLVPEQMINQLKQQQSVSSTAGKAGNIAADTFRRVVLPFSTKWLTGNVVEAGVRLGAVGAGPNAWRIGKNLLKEIEKLDAEQAIRVRAALTGGLLFGNRGLTVKRLNEHFEGTALEKPAAAVSVAGQMPVVKQLGWLMKNYTDGVFAFNRWIESNAQMAALGKHAKRDLQEMTNSWAKATRAQEKVLKDLAEGYVGGEASKNIHDAARYIDQTLGQYSRFSPPMRRFIQQAAPFLPWYLNAARFVFWTLPAKHPIKTGVAALVAQNLQADFDAQHEGLPPGDLRGEVVADDGTVYPLGRFTPFGAFGSVLGGGDEQLTALVDPLFPQFKSAGLAAFGLNFSGHAAKIPPEDRGPDGRGVPGAVRATMVFNSLLEAFVPVTGIGKRVREGGSTGYDNSTIIDPKVKPGTDVPGGAANRILNPFRPVSGIKGGARGGTPTATATPTPAAPSQPRSLEDELLDNLDSSLGDAQAQQALEDELLDNLYGGG